jgi:rfaE bifunctional protein nucleotidyltransferase chain/domain
MIVWTNGCFDVLHRGHIELFKYARSLGKELHVGIDSDKKVKADKGNTRPYNNEQDRKLMLEAIKYIDKVYIFNSRDELSNLVEQTQPHVLIVGSDWKGKEVIGEEYAKHVRFFERIEGYSTTKVINGK